MKRSKFFYMIIFLAFTCCKTVAQIPEYYFDIEDVFSTSYSFRDRDSTDLRFRALTVVPGEYSLIVIEVLTLGKKEAKRTKLARSIFLTEVDFSQLVIQKVEFIEWVSAKSLKVKLNGKDCYAIALDVRKENIKIDPVACDADR